MTDALLDTLPPHDAEAEECVLGSLLIDPDAARRIAGTLRSEDFYRSHNGTVFAAALALVKKGEPVDIETLTYALKAAGHYEEIGGLGYVSSLVGVVPTSVHIEAYARIVRDTATARRLITAAGQIARVAYDNTLDVETKLAKSSELLAKVTMGVRDGAFYTPEQQAELFAAMVADWEENKHPGLSSSFPRLNRLTAGYRPGDLYVIGACTGIGKTAWLATEARHLRIHGRRVMFASSEMPVADLVRRNAAALMKRDISQVEEEVRRGESTAQTNRQLAETRGSMGTIASHVYDYGGMTVERIRQHAGRMKASGGLDVLIVDYLQRLDPASWTRDRYKEVDNIAKSLKALAKELSIPVIVAAQFNLQRVEERQLVAKRNGDGWDITDKREPMLGDYRESGGIANEADVALGLHRLSKWLDGTKVDHKLAWLYVLKNRHGPEGRKIRLVWESEYTHYGEAQERGIE